MLKQRIDPPGCRTSGMECSTFKRQVGAPCCRLIFLRQRRLRSECCRWVLPSVLTLTATKRLLRTATGAGPNGGCMRYCGHRASETRLPPRHRPLPHHLDWWYRPIAVLPGELACALLRGESCHAAISAKEPGLKYFCSHRLDPSNANARLFLIFANKQFLVTHLSEQTRSLLRML